MAKSATNIYQAAPERYTGYSNVKTGKVLAIIGLILNLIFIIFVVYLYMTIGYGELLEMQEELLRDLESV